MNNAALVDTGFWIALFDRKDKHYDYARQRAELLDLVDLIVPWPTVYEALRTKFVRRPDAVKSFDLLLKRLNVTPLDDGDFREDAYSEAVRYSTRLRRPISMVDMLVRLLIADPNTRIKYLLTMNPKDFEDICETHQVEIL